MFNQEDEPFYRTKWYRVSHALLMLLMLIFSSLAVYYFETQVPTFDTEFDTKAALGYIEQISKTPHHVNSEENVLVFEYIKKFADDLKQNSSHEIEVQVDRQLLEKKASIPTIFDVRNLLVLIKSKRTDDCLMLSTHYDTKSMTFGTFDNSVGVGVAMQLLKHMALSDGTLEYSLLFNFNNAEEIGLFGASTFVKTELSKRVKGFINLDSGGYNGRSLLFRANNYDLLNAYKSFMPFPHTNAIVNDLLKRNIIPSDTDYRIYNENSLVGLDIAFYKHRSIYHTMKDNFSKISPLSVQNLGGCLYEIVKQIILEKSVKLSNIKSEEFHFFDIFGRFMVLVMTRNFQFLAFAINLVLFGTFVAVFKRSNIISVLKFAGFFLLSFCLHSFISYVSFVYIIPPESLYGMNWLLSTFSSVSAVFCLSLASLATIKYTEKNTWSLGLFGIAVFVFGWSSIVLEYFGFTAAYLPLMASALFWIGFLIHYFARNDVDQKNFIDYIPIQQLETDISDETAKSSWKFIMKEIAFFLYFITSGILPFMVIMELQIILIDAMSGTLTEYSSSALLAVTAITFSFFSMIGLSTAFTKYAIQKFVASICIVLLCSLIAVAIFVFPYSEAFPLQVNYHELHNATHSTLHLTSVLDMKGFDRDVEAILGKKPLTVARNNVSFPIDPIPLPGLLPYTIDVSDAKWILTTRNTFLTEIHSNCSYSIYYPHVDKFFEGRRFLRQLIQDDISFHISTDSVCWFTIHCDLMGEKYSPIIPELLKKSKNWVTYRVPKVIQDGHVLNSSAKHSRTYRFPQ